MDGWVTKTQDFETRDQFVSRLILLLSVGTVATVVTLINVVSVFLSFS